MSDSNKNAPSDKQMPSEDTLSTKTANEKLKKVQKEEIEDQRLIDEIAMLIERLSEQNSDLYEPSLNQIRSMIKSSSSTMVSIPKPLKFLRPHYPTLVELYKTWPSSDIKTLFADTLSLLGMAYDSDSEYSCLTHRLEAGINKDQIFDWGHEYIGDQFDNSSTFDTNALHSLSTLLVEFFFKHNAESDGIDLLHQIKSINLLKDFVDKNNFERACRYVVSCSTLIAPPSNVTFLRVAREIYLEFDSPAQAMEVSLRLGDRKLISEVFYKTEDRLQKIQLAFILAKQQIYMPELAQGDTLVLECMENTKLSERFLQVATQLNLMDPKSPEDIYKSSMDSRTSSQNIDSAHHNLASTFVNAFVNAGFGVDKLMTLNDDGNSWVYKNRKTGMLTASASLGMINLWDVEKGLTLIDKYLYTSDMFIKAGAIFGIGMLTSGVTDDSDTAKALLSEYLENPSKTYEQKLSAVMSLGIAYAGSNREDVIDLLSPFISDTTTNNDIVCFASLSAGLVCIGSCNGDVATLILQAFIELSENDINKPFIRFMIFGLGLLYFGQSEESETIIETLNSLDSYPLNEEASLMVQICSYAGT
ncbi:hypothetical protein BB560_004973, partial [Smittium megazygosporum]